MISRFLNESYTAYHTVENVCKMLREKGFALLDLSQDWNLSVGGSYYVVQNGSSVVAFKVGKSKVFHICESHTDSPCFKVKASGIVESTGATRLNTERYGGGLMYSFFDRPLKIAGRLLVEKDGGVESQLVVSSYNVVIPSLCVHHNPTANESFGVNAQNDTLPLFSQSKEDLYKTLTDKKVLDGDLFVVPATESFVAGVNDEFLCSPRIDNLTSVFESVTALINSNPQGIAICACLDNEEIGSGTRQGSPIFINTVLKKIQTALKFSETEKIAARENGLVLSVDNGHACHPAHPEKSDAQNKVVMNGGVVLKHHPNYATDGLSAALFKSLLQQNGIPYQDYYNRSDVRCGSTLGLVTAREVQMKTCDIGLAQLAMHSACETVGQKDLVHMEKALTAFFDSELVCKNGIFSWKK